MYFRKLETDRKAVEKNNENLKAVAAERLKRVAIKKKLKKQQKKEVVA